MTFKIHTYSLTLWESLYVSETNIFEDSVLAVAQVSGLDHPDTIVFFVLVEDVVGLAQTVSSSLVWKERGKKMFKGDLFSSGWNSVEHEQ